MQLEVNIPKHFENRHNFLTWCQRIAERRGQSYRSVVQQYEPRFRRFQRREFTLMERLTALREACYKVAQRTGDDPEALWQRAWEYYRQTGTIGLPR